MFLLLFFVSCVFAQSLLEQLVSNSQKAAERCGKLTTPSFEVLVEPFAQYLASYAYSGATCFSYTPYNYALFQQLSDGLDIWAYAKTVDSIKTAIDSEIGKFPEYWSKNYPDLPIQYDSGNGIYSICWGKK